MTHAQFIKMRKTRLIEIIHDYDLLNGIPPEEQEELLINNGLNREILPEEQEELYYDNDLVLGISPEETENELTDDYLYKERG